MSVEAQLTCANDPKTWKNRTFLKVLKNKAEWEMVLRNCVPNSFTSFLLLRTLSWEYTKKRNKIFHFKLTLQMITSGIGAASKPEKNEETKNNFLNLEDLFGGLLKNCQRQSNLEKRKSKIVINCIHHWKFQLLFTKN